MIANRLDAFISLAIVYYKACERFSRFACAKAAVNLVLQILMPGQGNGQQQQQQ